MGKMRIISNNKVDRTKVKFGEFEFVRIKIYDSSNGTSNISWIWLDDKERVADGYHQKLESKFLKESRESKMSSVS